MPSGKEAQAILLHRAQYLASVKVDEDVQQQEINYVRFKLGEKDYYAIPFQYIKEILANVIITKLPSAPQHIAGVINSHGALIAVYDLKYILQHQSCDASKPTPLIIVSGNNMIIGLLTDGIEGSGKYLADTLEAPIISPGIQNMEYISGLHNQNTTIINIHSILANQALWLNKN